MNSFYRFSIKMTFTRHKTVHIVHSVVYKIAKTSSSEKSKACFSQENKINAFFLNVIEHESRSCPTNF